MANKNGIWALSVVMVVALLTGHPEQARSAESDGSLLHDTLTASVGTFLLDTNTDIRVDGTAGQAGTDVNLGRDLGFKDADRIRVDATWRFAKHHKLRALYFNTSQSRTRTIDREIDVGDTVFPVNAEITAKNSISVTELAYEYVFMQRDSFELAGTFGAHIVKFDFGLSGNGSVNGGDTVEFRSESHGVTAPLPVFGVRGLWQFHPQWYLDGQAQYFALKYDAYDGRVTDLRIGVTRMFGAHWGVGAGWNRFTTRLGVDKDNFNGEIRWRYSGGQLFLTGSF